MQVDRSTKQKNFQNIVVCEKEGSDGSRKSTGGTLKMRFVFVVD